MPATYIDIHTHHTEYQEEVYQIRNYHEDFGQVSPGDGCSMGLHPWYLGDLRAQMNSLKQYSATTEVRAIGECGLDNLCPTPQTIQEEAFRQQIAWANELQKPIIVHCVKAFDRALFLLRKANVPVIFHGYNKKATVARAILEQGYYISFGAALLQQDSGAAAVLETIPAQRFFLETDDAPVALQEVYHAAARIRKTGPDALILQLQQNFKKVFSI